MRKLLKLVAFLALFGLLLPVGVYGQDYTSDSLSLTVYSDGSVDVEYVIEPDTTQAQINVTLIGEGYQDILVVDPDGIILDWAFTDDGIEVDSLGSTSLTISYTTDSITNKIGSQWSISVNSDIPILYTLPTGAVLVGLNPAPVGISIIDNQAVITMPAGFSSISYLIGTTGTKEHALVLLNTARADVNEALGNGIVIDEAEGLLAQATQAYQNEQYTQSEQYSTQASESVKETEAQAAEALTSINTAKSIIETKRDQIAPETITEAQNMLDLAENQYETGDYSEAQQGAEEAYSLVFDAPIVEPSGNMTLYIAGAVIVVIIGAGYWFMSQRGDPKLQKPDTRQPEVDLDMVFRKNPHLRTDDKAILRFLEETGGAFITEVRDRFDIPKSSAWRMVRRLEEDGLILSSKVGRETYLQLRGDEEQ